MKTKAAERYMLVVDVLVLQSVGHRWDHVAIPIRDIKKIEQFVPPEVAPWSDIKCVVQTLEMNYNIKQGFDDVVKQIETAY